MLVLKKIIIEIKNDNDAPRIPSDLTNDIVANLATIKVVIYEITKYDCFLKIVITISITSANTLRIPPARRIAKGTLYSINDVP